MKLQDVLDTVFFTADMHLGHTNIIKYCNRPFRNIQEHDRVLLDNFNQVLDNNSIVYHLGDFTLKDDPQKYMSQLVGQWYFLPGSHDMWMRNFTFWNKRQKAPALLTLSFSRLGDRPLPVVLCHYAMRRWDRSHYGSYHLYDQQHTGIWILR